MWSLSYNAGAEKTPIQAICPWMEFVNPGVILNKDGSFLAGFCHEYASHPDEVDADLQLAAIERAYHHFDERMTGWWIVDKRGDMAPPVFRRYFFLLFTGATNVESMKQRVARLQGLGATSFSAIAGGIRESLSVTAAFARSRQVMAVNLASFQNALTEFLEDVPAQLSRLRGADLVTSLSVILNRASSPDDRDDQVNAPLDTWLPINSLAADHQTLQFVAKDTRVFGASVALLRWKESRSSELFNLLGTADVDLTVCQTIRFLGQGSANDSILPAIQDFQLTQFNDPTGILGYGTDRFAYHSATVFVYETSIHALNEKLTSLFATLDAHRFSAVRERLHTAPSFAAMLPGQWSQQTRYGVHTLKAVAALSPLYPFGD